MVDDSSERLKEYRSKRDFARTSEPPGGDAADRSVEAGLRFVVQKHEASHLHFDLRLEMEGVMRSWAVPKGPSADTSVRRLAMEVEDHPIEYNDFEGTIPAGEYGGGTVMLWDHGTYAPEATRRGESAEAAILRGYRAGKLSIVFAGERLRGTFTLVRTDTVSGGERSKWLLLKQDDHHADPPEDLAEEFVTSVETDRTMEEIAAGVGGERVWRSNRGAGAGGGKPGHAEGGEGRTTFQPMLASNASAIPPTGDWVFEPKYDGIRILALASGDSVALITRNGNDKAPQFPEVAAEVRALVSALGAPVVLDGEIVALEQGRIARFERLQARMHLSDARRARRSADAAPAALVAFDLLLVGDDVLLEEGWRERRVRLEKLLAERETDGLRLSATSTDPEALIARGRQEGWEGIMAKRSDARYQPGRRTRDWLKVKLENRQELVVGGWTEPRGSRPHLGALLLGYYDAEGDFIYAGHTGTGFSNDQLADLYARLKRLERKTPPFTERPTTNATPHWVTPRVVVEIRFNEWTREGRLRQPVFLGVRDDKDAREVGREPGPVTAAEGKQNTKKRRSGGQKDSNGPKHSRGRDGSNERKKAARAGKRNEDAQLAATLDTPVVRQIAELTGARKGGRLDLGSGVSLPITSLDKLFYPESGHTKGDLFTYYARLASLILPAMADRPLVLKRYPNGVEGESFYQQAAPDSPPDGVRVETLKIEGKKQRRLVGGDLATLLYTIQLGAISFDPWHSRVGHLDSADYTILDLDPGPGADFGRVIEVARRVQEEMERLGLHGALKTSGSSGLHIYLPLPAETPLEAATLIAQIVATRVARAHPRIATVERMTRNRPEGTVYVDYLQNILGKTVAGVYAIRAKSTPTVSTPLKWEELTDDLDLRDFTIDTVPARVARLGDLWHPAMKEPNSLDALTAGMPE